MNKISFMVGRTILVVEDNDAVALGLDHAFRSERFMTLRADTAQAARQIALNESFDLMILDIRLPDGSGFDLCREFRSSGLRQPILMLTARDEIVDKVVGLELGADDYMTKPFDLQELLARVRSLIRRSYGNLSSDRELQYSIDDLSIDLAAQRVRRGAEEIRLTATEFRLLAFLAAHIGEPISRRRLISEVWGYEHPYGDLRTVDVHIRNLRQKIEKDPSEPRLIVTVRGAGYMLRR